MAKYPVFSIAAASLLLGACNPTMPESHTVTLQLDRPLLGFEAGEQSVRITVSTVPGSSPTRVGGDFFHPLMQAPTRAALVRASGEPLAVFEGPGTHQTIQIEGMGRDCTRDVDQFSGESAEHLRLSGRMTTEYAMHYVDDIARNAWLLQGDFALEDAHGTAGSIRFKEYADW